MTRNFREMLEDGWEHSVLCIGLDPDLKKIPQHIKNQFGGRRDAVATIASEFCIGIVDSTCHLRPLAYKPNQGFFLRLGPAGINALIGLVAYIKERSPTSVIIDDCKDGDIGDSMANYVAAALDPLDTSVDADAMTANPYLGPDTFQQLLDRKDKGAILLCKTSNKGSAFLQDRPVRLSHEERTKFAGLVGKPFTNPEWIPLYQLVAASAECDWNKNDNCALVVGATYPSELEQVRTIAPEMPLLLPGFGKQGAPVSETIRAGRRKSDGRGIIANVGSDILYASAGEDCFNAAAAKAEMWHNQLLSFANA